MDVTGADLYPDIYERVNVFNLPVSKLAAGADLSFSVPVGIIWNVVSLTAVFTASAGVANRTVTFFIKDQGGTIVYQYAIPTAITASQAGTFTFSEDVVTPTTFANGGNLLQPLPSTWLPPLWSFGTTTTNIQAADQWSAVACWVQEILPPAGE